jgi:hypothetical protein
MSGRGRPESTLWRRALSTLLVVGLIGGTAAAFAVTERLKLVRSPITDTHVTKVFSPVCGCPTGRASIEFALRSADRVTVQVERAGRVVQTIVRSRPARPGRFEVRWNGLDGSGRPFPEATYKPRVHLSRARRTIVLPNPIVLDTTPPRVVVVRFFPHGALTPDKNHIHERLDVRYRVSEPAHVSLYVDGKGRYYSRFTRLDDHARWFGQVGGHGVPAGSYTITLRARDLAGNLSKVVPVTTVRVRYVELRRRILRASVGARFVVRILTDSPTVRWRLGTRHGTGRANLVLRAPARPGRYRLTVRVGDHAARGVVVVR